MTPTRKVSAAGTAGAVSIIVVYLLEAVTGAEVPGAVGAALATILAFAGGYIVRDAAPDERGAARLEFVFVAALALLIVLLQVAR